MAVEQYTESITLTEMKCTIGKNDFGIVFPQGDVSDIDKLNGLLKNAGGKPKFCEINDYSQHGNGKAKPEYIITFNDDSSTIIVVECKSSIKKHATDALNRPKDFAVDGVLYYAKYLKDAYNVIAIAISGTVKDKMKADTFYWAKGENEYQVLSKAHDIILEPQNYMRLIKGEKLQKSYSLDEIRETAITLHDYLREIKVIESHKPIFIAGILIALNDEDFLKSYSTLPSYRAVMVNIQNAIENVLSDSDIKNSRISYIKQVFKILLDNTKFAEIPLGHRKSITWYVEQLELKIKPMMDYADNTLDALGVFYHEFIKYSGGDGSGLGIVLTPQHLTEFMCDLAGVNKYSRVVELFTVKYGINMELIHCQKTTAEDPDAVAFVARTSVNNGIAAYVKRDSLYPPQPAGLITCAGGGSVLSTFVQNRDFYSGRDLYLLIPKTSMSIYSKLFCCTVIRTNKYRYSYGRQANKTLSGLILKLPAKSDHTPDFEEMERYMKSLPFSDQIRS